MCDKMDSPTDAISGTKSPGQMNFTLLELLRCPESGQPVAEASPELVQRLEALRSKGFLLDARGEVVQDAIQYGLVRKDRTRFFPIREGIPVMLQEESIVIPY